MFFEKLFRKKEGQTIERVEAPLQIAAYYGRFCGAKRP